MNLFFSLKPLTKEKAKNRTFANELGARLQSAVNGNGIGNKSGTLRKRPTNDDTREWNFNINCSSLLFSLALDILYIPSYI